MFQNGTDSNFLSRLAVVRESFTTAQSSGNSGQLPRLQLFPKQKQLKHFVILSSMFQNGTNSFLSSLAQIMLYFSHE